MKRTTPSPSRYPPDLVGYGAQPPRAHWPGKARIALQFVLNYEEGGESSVLHGDPASEQFLSKDATEIERLALQTLEGHLRAILGTLTVEEIYQNRDAFAGKVQEVGAGDMANMGLQIVSFTIRDIRDNQGYLDALGKPRTAQVKRDAIIAQAEADRDSTIKSAQANQAGQTAKFEADTVVASSNRDYQMRLAEYQPSVNRKKAEADLAYDLQRFKTGQSVKKEEVQVEVVEKQSRIQVQEQEILRKQKELEATIQKPAEAERSRVQTLAEAEKLKRRPIHLTFFLTKKCNSLCPFCFYLRSRDKQNSGEELQINEIRSISQSLGKLLWLAFSGGEIYLREDLVEISRIFYENNKPAVILLPTNGLLPDLIFGRTEEILRNCRKSVIVVKLSLDGLNGTHDSIRDTPGSFRSTMETYQLLSGLLKRCPHFELGINTVLCSANRK